jgi:hypothetical protein
MRKRTILVASARAHQNWRLHNCLQDKELRDVAHLRFLRIVRGGVQKPDLSVSEECCAFLLVARLAQRFSANASARRTV